MKARGEQEKVNMAEAAAAAIIQKFVSKGLTVNQAEEYVRKHEKEVTDFALRLIAAHHLKR